MRKRPLRLRPVTRRPLGDLALLEIGPHSTRSVRLGGPYPVSGDPEITLAPAHDGIVDVRSSGESGVRVNDVEVRGIARARAGDLIAVRERFFLVQRFSPVPVVPTAVASHEAFGQRLFEEVDRAARSRSAVSLLVVWCRALLGNGLRDFLAAPEVLRLGQRGGLMIVGQLAPGTLALLCPGASATEADEKREQLSEALGRLGRPFLWGWASVPSEALHAATLWGRALDRLLADQTEPAEDLPHADPVMARLWGLCDLWAAMKGGVGVQGEEGSGRETLARVIHERQFPRGPFIVARSATFDSSPWRESVERARGGSLYVRHLDALPHSERGSFWAASVFRPMAGLQPLEQYAPAVTIAVPPLRDRPLDILPIAEHIVARCRDLDTAGKLKLSPSARILLSRGSWDGGVRGLKNLLQRAALMVDGSGEILPEQIASSGIRVERSGTVSGGDVRTEMRGFERKAFLDALEHTSWNVTEAARQLGLPRRTVVHRMGKLGLKRPRRTKIT